MDINTPQKEPAKQDDYAYSVKKLANSRIELAITVPKENVKQTYNKILDELAKEIQIKGFRKGYVPKSILLSKFDQHIKAKCLETVANTAFTAVIPKLEKQPYPNSTPKVDIDKDKTINPEEDFTFTLLYDVYPEITLGDIEEFELEVFEVNISDEDIQRGLKEIQNVNSFAVSKEGGAVSGDIVSVDLVELDAQGRVLEKTRNENYRFTVGELQSKYDPEISSEVKGMKAGDEKKIKKALTDSEAVNNASGKELTVQFKVRQVQEIKVPEIDDELAQDVNEEFKTVADLKDYVIKRLHEAAERVQFEVKKKKLLKHLLEHSAVEVPETAVQDLLKTMMGQNMPQSGNEDFSFQEYEKSHPEQYKALRQNVEAQAKEQFLILQGISDYKIETGKEEIEARIHEQAGAAANDSEKLQEYYKDSNVVSQIHFELNAKKLFELLISKCKKKKGEAVSFSQLVKMQEEGEPA